MKKTVTFGVLAATALTLAACNGETAEAPAAEPVATEAAPATETALDDAAAAAEGTDPNSNPIGPNAPAAPVTGEVSASAEAAPAAE
jgi:hypothetical protein